MSANRHERHVNATGDMLTQRCMRNADNGCQVKYGPESSLAAVFRVVEMPLITLVRTVAL